MAKLLRNRVREARQQRGMSQRDLARVSGLARQTIVTVEQNSRTALPTGQVMLRLAEVLNEDISGLFWTEDIP